MAGRGWGMGIRKIAIACQGGGFHGAFTAGVLRRLLAGMAERTAAGTGPGFEIIALSGSSAGAINAFAAWYGLARCPGEPAGVAAAIETLDRVWEEFRAETPSEVLFNTMVVRALRAHGQSTPTLKVSPYSVVHDLFMRNLRAAGLRPEFYDFAALLDRVAPDFAAIDQGGARPRLILGAVEILSGCFCAFDTRADPASRRNITLAAVRASGTLPDLRRAERIEAMTLPDGQVRDGYFWDGLFAQNPPVREFLADTPLDERPDEIWVVRMNPQTRERLPVRLEEIEDRRTELSGTLALNQELAAIAAVNDWRRHHADFAAATKHVTVREVTPAGALRGDLDLADKFDRSGPFVDRLKTDGEACAEAFLAAWPDSVPPSG